MKTLHVVANSTPLRLLSLLALSMSGCVHALPARPMPSLDALLENGHESNAPILSRYAQTPRSGTTPSPASEDSATSSESGSAGSRYAAKSSATAAGGADSEPVRRKPASANANAAAATEEAVTAIVQSLKAPESVSDARYDELQRQLADGQTELPPLVRQQLIGMLEYSRKHGDADKRRPAVNLPTAPDSPPAAAPPSTDSPSPAPPTDPSVGRPSGEKRSSIVAKSTPPIVREAPESITTPHVTVNVTTSPPPVATASGRTESVVDGKNGPAAAGESPGRNASTPSTSDATSLAHSSGSSSSPAAVVGVQNDAANDSTKTKHERNVRPGQWRESLLSSIDALDRELRQADDTLSPEERTRLAAHLRLLYVAADRHEDAVREIDHLSKQQKEYWKKQLHALVVSLDADGVPVESRRAALTLRHLREAVEHLANDSTLDVRNLAFCNKVDGYGTYSEFAKNEFKPDQEVLLYVEVDNFAVEEKSGVRKAPTYETELRGAYQIVDAAGRRLADVELPLDRQTCRNHRRDYFIAYRLYLPKRIEPGDYTLRLTMEDLKGKKFGTASVDLTIKP